MTSFHSIIRRIWRVIFLSSKMAIALILSPLLLVDWLLRKLTPHQPELPEGILSKPEMRAMQATVGRGDENALRLWLRSAFYYELVENYGLASDEAAGGADELANKMNAADGYALAVERV